MNGKTRDLLLEAWRRWLCFGANKGLGEAWTGLGSKTMYKPALDAGLMEWVNTPRPRCDGWLRLTPKGIENLRIILRQRHAPDYVLI